MATFWDGSPYVFLIFCKVITYLGFEDETLVLIASVLDHCFNIFYVERKILPVFAHQSTFKMICDAFGVLSVWDIVNLPIFALWHLQKLFRFLLQLLPLIICNTFKTYRTYLPLLTCFVVL